MKGSVTDGRADRSEQKSRRVGMAPIGKSTVSLPGSLALLFDREVREDEPEEASSRRTVQRVGSGMDCEEEGGFTSWVCPRDDTVVHVPLTCSEARLCPSCSKRWAFREAKKAAYRLGHVRKRKVYGAVEPRHVVVSFAEGQGEELSLDDYDELFVRAWAVLKKMGSRGGVGLVHPWRHQPDSIGGETVRSVMWVPGPHCHFLVWGWLDLSKQPGGAFVRVIHAEQKTIVGTLGYLLDHAGVVVRKHALRYYGVACYNKCPGVPPAPREIVVPLCPMCHGKMRKLDVLDATAWPAQGVPWMGWKERVGGVEHDLEYSDGVVEAGKDRFPKGSVGTVVDGGSGGLGEDGR